MPRKQGSAARNLAKWQSLVMHPESECRVLLQDAFDALREADSLDEIRVIFDAAEVIQVCARETKAGLWVRIRASELKLLAEHRAGGLLRSMSLRGGDRKSRNMHLRDTLDSLGVTQNQSTRWQKMATVPVADLRILFAEYREANVKPTASSVLELAR